MPISMPAYSHARLFSLATIQFGVEMTNAEKKVQQQIKAALDKAPNKKVIKRKVENNDGLDLSYLANEPNFLEPIIRSIEAGRMAAVEIRSPSNNPANPSRSTEVKIYYQYG